MVTCPAGSITALSPETAKSRVAALPGSSADVELMTKEAVNSVFERLEGQCIQMCLKGLPMSDQQPAESEMHRMRTS